MALVLALAGCGARGPGPEAAAPLRQDGAPVAAQVDADAARLQGDWVVVAGAGVPQGAAVRFLPGAVEIAGTRHPLVETGPGRFSAGGRALWVHWLDADARTAALGDPEGGWVFVIDRTGAPGERLAAARTILDWYGYDPRATGGA
ncbi:lipocalin [Roseivivax isoporae LMG 25204]|uniref:Lipocalin n=1 Tax=Roseivivax isoporae LMG 25204 TaxID=1449351 RepID=X7F896_9RHOB|nr:lipocalin [Roseivivax isoporae LMG 25204]